MKSRVNCQFPIRFSKLSVQLNNAIYNDYCRVTDGHGISAASDGDFTEKDLYLVPGKTKLYTFTFLPVKDDINSQIEVMTHLTQDVMIFLRLACTIKHFVCYPYRADM